MSKLRFALVGCGRIAGKHLEAINQLEASELAAVCDVQEERAKHTGEKYGVPYYTDYNQMLQETEVDVVNILTPSGFHAAHTIDIVQKYGKHIVCEKPMALRLQDADEMIRTCEQHNVRLFIALQNRFNLPVQLVKKTLDEKRFGKLVLGTVCVRWARTQEYYDADSWRGTWELDGGCLTNQASHHVDLLQWMLGEPVEVSAKIATRLLNIVVEDTAAAVIKFANGALGIVEATTAARPGDLEGSLSILGEKGTAEIGGFAVNKIQTWSFAEGCILDSAVMEEYSENPPNVYGFGHKRLFEHVIDCIQNKKPSMIDGCSGRKSLELITAMYESEATGKTVHLRFSPHHCKLGGLRNE